MTSQTVLSMRVDPLGAEQAVRLVMDWVSEERARVVCAANVHMVMEAWDHGSFRTAVAEADLAVADGRPVWLACRVLGSRDASHLRGQDLMLRLCAAAAAGGVPIALLGSTDAVLAKVRTALAALYPALDVAVAVSPPFRPLTPDEDEAMMATLRSSGARILFVALGCPKQELWMIDHTSKASCVMVGVGAAFEMMAGERRVAPGWMQRSGLEWAFRLAAEPRRLWRRYALHNLRFVVLLVLQLAGLLNPRGPA